MIVKRIIRLWAQLQRGSKIRLLLVLLLMLLAAFAEIFSLGLVLPFLGLLLDPELALQNKYVVNLMDLIGFDDRKKFMLFMTVLFVGGALVAASCRVLLIWSQIRLAYGIGSELSEAIYRRILFLPYKFHADNNSSNLITSVSRRADQVVNEVLLPIMVSASSTFLIAAIIVAITYIDPVVAMSAGLAFGLIYFFVLLVTRHRLARYGSVVNRQQAEVIKVLQEALGGIRDIIIDGAQDLYCAVYRRVDVPLRRAQSNNLIIGGSPRFIIEGVSISLIAFFAYFLTSSSGGLQNMLPTLGVLVLGAQKILPLLQVAYVSFSQVQAGQPALEDVLDVLEKPIPKFDSSSIVDFQSEIRLDDIWFRYGSGEEDWVLQKINLRISRGDRIGFVGGTGCGKSTLLDLIMGLLVPNRGKLRIDGIDISEENQGSWQRHIAHVPQSVYLADSSVLQNIAFGVPLEKIDVERVRQAAQSAQIADVIESWEQGYQTVVGERGARLSGGQRQRIGLARALYKNADVLVLDEATSALDNDTESAVMTAIEALDSGITVLIVAHRLTTLNRCNKIVHLKNGEIEKIGTYEQILI